MSTIRIVGRRSSLFTRLALIYAEALHVPYELVPIFDMATLDSAAYADNPALKLPILLRDGSTLFGTQNICRALAEIAQSNDLMLVWPEQLRDDVSRNAQELVWHCMAAQVQLVMGTIVGKLPADNVYFVKTRAGIEHSLAWLDAHLSNVLHTLPAARALSLFEASLFCLIEHLEWRGTMTLARHESLSAFAREFSARPAAMHTTYCFDAPPA